MGRLLIAALVALLAMQEEKPRLRCSPNFRELHGHKTRDGATVRRGLLYRSEDLAEAKMWSRHELLVVGSMLKLKRIFDLRPAAERKARPDFSFHRIENVPLDVLADADRKLRAALEEALRNPKGAKADEVSATYARMYRDLVTKPAACKAYGRLFSSLAEGDMPAVFHCDSGKDVTGWAAAALLELLGIPRDQILKDYLLSNDRVLPSRQEAIDAFVAAGGDAAIPPMILGVREEYLKAAFAEVEAKHGSIDKYFSDALGVNDAAQKKLRDALLEKR